MKKSLLITGVLLVLAAVLTACGGQTTQTPTDTQVVVTKAPSETPTDAVVPVSGDALLGGKLYDSWIDELAAEPPTDFQPLWATSSSTASDTAPEDTWLCVSCHGVDYNGDNGFTGIIADAGKDPNQILSILKGSTNPDHDFSSVLDDQALSNIALFINKYVMDITTIVKDGQPVSGDPVEGKKLFEDTCTDCHGPQALAINFHSDAEPEYPATIANENPAELLGKLRFGVPGMPDMPSGIDNGWTNQNFADIISYIATLPTSSPITEGGCLYDEWFAAFGLDAPAGDQPLWATQTSSTITGAETWRCSECHGWDYKGVDGVYASGENQTGFPGILNATKMSTDELTAWLDGSKNVDHNFSTFMNTDEIARLEAFIQDQVFDKSTIINSDKTVNGGDPVHGKLLFESVCKICHGVDGKTINFGDDSNPEYFGTVAADNPWEFYNKASVGVPGETMPAGLNLGWKTQDILDLLTYAQTLPTK